MEEAEAFDEMMRVVESCLRRIGWRLRPASKHELLYDFLFLCTGLRPAILVDYDGLMPELEINLCKLLSLAQQESNILKPIRVLVISEMAYLINVKTLAEYASWSLSSPHHFRFVHTEVNPPKILSTTDNNELLSDLAKIQKQFSEVFPVGIDADLLPVIPKLESKSESESESSGHKSLSIDLTSFMMNVEISIPSLNGWLLGYPVTYLFSNDNVKLSMGVMSNQSLNLYKINVCRNQRPGVRQEHTLMCFSVPISLSIRGEREPWIEEFLVQIRSKIERCNHVWSSVRCIIESSIQPRLIVL